MVLGKVTQDISGADGEKYHIGEILKVDSENHLLKVGYLQKIDDDTPTVSCVCGRVFMLIQESENPEQLLEAHVRELGKGHGSVSSKKVESKEEIPV